MNRQWRAFVLSIAVLMFSAAAWTALIPTGTTVYYIDGKPHLGFIFGGDPTIVSTITVQPNYLSPVMLPPEWFVPTEIDWADIPVLSLDTLVIGVGPYGYPDINTLLGYDQIIYVVEPEELDFLGIPEPASFLLVMAGCVWACRKRTEPVC